LLKQEQYATTPISTYTVQPISEGAGFSIGEEFLLKENSISDNDVATASYFVTTS
jgi:hypothetical protein